MASLVAVFGALRSSLGISKVRRIRVIAVRAFASDLNGGNAVGGTSESDEVVRDKILTASLAFVPEHGWSKKAIIEGARSSGFPGTMHGIGGGADLIAHFQRISNKKLIAYLKEITAASQASPTPQSVQHNHAIVEDAVRRRLEMIVPYTARWPQALAIMSLPPNMPDSLATLLTMVDDICYYAGDRSVDFNWYTKRIAVASIYKATELYLIQDSSPGHEKSWRFLSNRMSDLKQLVDVVQHADFGGLASKDTMTAAFTTARNILGLNWNR